MPALKAGVAKAIDELREHFAQLVVTVYPASCGGAFIVIDDVPVGPPFAQATSWVGFFLSSACPEDDTYPFFVRPDLSFADGRALSSPFHANHRFPTDAPPGVAARPAVMVSRRQRNQSCWSRESPLLKLLTVLKWMSEK